MITFTTTRYIMQPETPIQHPALMKLKRRELSNHFAKLLDKGTPRLVVNEMRDTVLRQRKSYAVNAYTRHSRTFYGAMY